MPGAYTSEERLYDGKRTIVHRAFDPHTKTRVIVKQLRSGEATAADLRRIRAERDLLAAIDDPGVAKLLDHEERGIDAQIVIEDIGGETLAKHVARGTPNILDGLRIAAAIARALGAIHRKQIVHKDVSPNNIAVAPDGRVQIFDFDLAERLPPSGAGLPPATHFQGTLLYVSPEQTGRGSLPIDERSDLYSLGAVLYELFTGRAPFAGADMLEVVHAHLAQTPVAPHVLAPQVPERVSAIVMRLLEKAPADRYQSAHGVERDLLTCADALAEDGEIGPFPLGRSDVQARLRLTEKLQGRERDLARIVEAFEACRTGPPALVVVAGPAGIGKSALVRTLTGQALSSTCFVGAGKLEASRPDAPYAAFIEPLRALAAQIFGAESAVVAALRERVAETIGATGQPLVDLVPELSFLLEIEGVERAPSPPLTRDRAHALFTGLLRSLASQERPIVLALDDMQWADAASIDLLGALARAADVRGLCLVVTSRPDGLVAGNPFGAFLSALTEEGIPRVHVELAPLGIPEIETLLTDTLKTPPGGAQSLAALVARKTLGNALSVGIFLSAIHRAELLFFDPGAGRWAWDAAGIEALQVSDNAVDLLSARMALLGEDVRRALQACACLGGRFDEAIVAAVSDVSAADAAAALATAASEGLIVPVDGGFRFAHDRVLEAAYRSLSPGDARALHARACRAQRAAIEHVDRSHRLFDLLRHAVAAGDAFDPEERREIARLGLVAGRRARTAAAFDAAEAHFRAALAHLPPGAWARDHDLAYALHFGAVECAYTAARHEEGDRMFPILVERAASDVVRARAWGMRALGVVGAREFAEALRYVREGCALVGVRIPEKATLPIVLYELARTTRAVRGRTAADLAALPPLSDERAIAALEVLAAGLAAAYLSDRNLFTVMALRGTTLIAQHGNSVASGDLYALYAVVVGAVLRDQKRMLELGRLSVELSKKYFSPMYASRVWMINGAFFHHYEHHVAAAAPLLEEAQRLGMLGGENAIPGFAAYFAVVASFFAGRSLDDSLAACDAQLRVTELLSAADAHESLVIVRQTILSLQGNASAPGELSTPDFDAVQLRARLEARGTVTAQMSLRFFTAVALAHADRFTEALAQLDGMPGNIDVEWALLFQLGECVFLRALVLSAILSRGAPGFVERQRHLLSLRLCVRKLADWAERAPINFKHKHALAVAELAGLTGDADAALRAYEKAITGARENGFVQDAAIGLERTGRFFLQRGMIDVGVSYLTSALRAYRRWGATAKVALLDRELPGIAEGGTTAIAPRGTAAESSSSGATSVVGLEVPTLVKATQLLSSERRLDQLIERMMTIVAEGAGAQRGALLLVQGDVPERHLFLHAQVTAGRRPTVLAEPTPLDQVSTVPAAIARWVARTRQTVRLDDASADGPFTHDPYVLARRSRSVLVLPLVWQDETLGALALENDLVPGAFGPQRVELLRTLCAQLAILIQNVRYYAELEEKVAERTKALREAQTRIVTLEKDATEVQMAGGFAHEMRNALAGARMVIEMGLGADAPGSSLGAEASRRLQNIFLAVAPALGPEVLAEVRSEARALNDVLRRTDEILHRTGDAVGRGLSITNEVLAYASLRREEPGESLVLLKPLVEELARDLATPRVLHEIRVPADIAVQCRPIHLRSIIENLARNAQEAVTEAALARGAAATTGAQVAGRISITAMRSPAAVTIEVEDDGPGMPPAVLSRIYEPFFSTKPTSGIGLGLGVVRKLVLLYGGAITVDSVLDRGTRFTVTFPTRHLA